MAKKRKMGEGTLRHRKDGRWEGRMVIGYDENGWPKTKSVLAKTRKECLEKLEKLKREDFVFTGRLPSRAKADMPFGEWIELWYTAFAKPGIRPNTQATYESQIRLRIVPALGKIPLNKLQQSDLQAFYAAVKSNSRIRHRELSGSGVSNRVVRACHAICRMALEKAVEQKLIAVNPAIGCKLPPKKAKEMQVLTQEEMRRFLIQARADGCYELAVLELSTGLRRGELLALRWEDLNLKTGELYVHQALSRTKAGLTLTEPKTKGSIRTVILPPSVLQVLKDYRETVESDWLFPSPLDPEKPRDPGAVRKKLQNCMERAGCKRVRFHDLRHTFATMALAHGMDAKTLSTVIGHVSVHTTLDIYSHVTDQMQMQAAGMIEQKLGSGESYSPQEAPTAATIAPAKQAEPFVPVTGKYRKSGTGGVYQINDRLWEGRYSPIGANGKRVIKTVYAKTRDEAERLLEEMIPKVRAEIKAEKQRLKNEQTMR